MMSTTVSSKIVQAMHACCTWKMVDPTPYTSRVYTIISEKIYGEPNIYTVKQISEHHFMFASYVCSDVESFAEKGKAIS